MMYTLARLVLSMIALALVVVPLDRFVAKAMSEFHLSTWLPLAGVLFVLGSCIEMLEPRRLRTD